MAKAQSKEQSPEVWIGGIATMPAYIMGEGEPHRPEVLLWVDQKSLAVVGSLVDKPGTLVGRSSDHLHMVMKEPMFGPPRTPARLRVASPEMAKALRAGHPALDIVCGPTPELDEVVRSMNEMMAESQKGEAPFVVPDIAPEAYASFFAAAAALYRAKPWKVVPPDEVLSVTVPGHGLDKAALTVMGHLGESFGFLLFTSAADFQQYLDAAEALERGHAPAMPAYRVLDFVRGADVAPEDRKTIASQHWPVASPQAYPRAIVVDKDMVTRPLSATELASMEAMVTGLAKLVGEKKAITAAFEGDEPCVRSYTVQTRNGDVTVIIRAPHEETPEDGREDGRDDGCEVDVLDALFALEEEGTIAEEELRQPLEDALCAEFAKSPEGEKRSELEGHRLLMELGAQHIGASIATLEPWAVREVLFDIVPRKVSVDASAAGALVEDCRAFYRFLERAYGLEQAEACLQILGPRAESQLAAALSDSSKFGPAKALFTAGSDAGFDMQTKEGIEAWIRTVNDSGGKAKAKAAATTKTTKAKTTKAKTTKTTKPTKTPKTPKTPTPGSKPPSKKR
jgi:hypothetical protein